MQMVFLDFFLRNLGSNGVWSNLVVVYLDVRYNSFSISITLHTLKETLLLTITHIFLMDFCSPTLYLSLTSLEHHPSSTFPYLPLIICFPKAYLSVAYRQIHLLRSALLSEAKHLTPNSPFFLSEQTIATSLNEAFSLNSFHPKGNPFESVPTSSSLSLASRKVI